jgi:hypothetical protein
MMSTVFSISVAYVVLGVVLLLMGLTSRLPWGVKALTIIVTSAFFVVVFFETRGLLSYPGNGKLPARFQLLGARIVEPDHKTGDQGAIYLWVEEIDENNVPKDIPRNIRMPYTPPLADKAQKARERIMEGNLIAGESQDMEEGDRVTTEEQQVAEQEEKQSGGQRSQEGHLRLDMDELLQKAQRVEFVPMPGAVLPPKTPQ